MKKHILASTILTTSAIFIGCTQNTVPTTTETTISKVTPVNQQTAKPQPQSANLTILPASTHEQTQQTGQPKNATLESTNPYKYNLKNLKVGQKFGGLTVTSIKPFKESAELSEQNVVIDFKGEITVSAEYFAPTEEGFDMGPFFKIDHESQNNFPLMENDTVDNEYETEGFVLRYESKVIDKLGKKDKTSYGLRDPYRDWETDRKSVV